jgi:O-antigen ligase
LTTQSPDRLPFLLLAALLLVAFLFGGGGIGAPLANLAVQLTALAVLALRRDAFAAFWRESPLALRALVALSIALPLAQIVPLPESLWQNLPGREFVTASLELTAPDGGPQWMPFSLDARRTLLAASALITPLAVLCAGWTLPRERLIDLGWGVVALGLVTVLLGAAQIAGGTEAATFYGSPRPGQIVLGTFANRNSTGLFLTFALGLAALLPAPRPHPVVLPARLATCALLLLTVALTQSRTALVLAAIPVLLGVLRALSGRTQGRSATRTAMVAVAALAIVAVGAGALVVAAPGRLGATLERFEAKDDPRRFIWDDAVYTAGRHWPAGAGIGTFDELYQVDESLENLTLRRAGRAHNDYIEITIEAGAPGLALVAAWLVLLGGLSWRARRSRAHWVAWAGSAFLLAIALQSVTDYPLRNQTILALGGFALLLLARVAAGEPERMRLHERPGA